jgi:hypothetical protein
MVFWKSPYEKIQYMKQSSGGPSTLITPNITNIQPIQTYVIPKYHETFIHKWCLNSSVGLFKSIAPKTINLKSDYTATFDNNANLHYSIRWIKDDDTNIQIIIEDVSKSQGSSQILVITETWALFLNKSISELSGGPGGIWVFI